MLLTRPVFCTFYKSLFLGFLLFTFYAHATPVGFVESLQDESLQDGSPFTNLHCTEAAVVSPDDKFAYSSSFCDGALNIFSRNPDTGKLTLLSSLVGDEKTGEGLRNVKWLAMHPNGKYLFAFGITGIPISTTKPYHHAIYVYERDTTTGLLTFSSEFKNSLIDNAWNFHISADGHFLYVGRQAGIEVLQITSNGILTHTQSQHTTSTISNKSYTRSFLFSPDNKYVYVDSGNSSISWLLRDAASGSLTYAGELLSTGMTVSSDTGDIESLGRSNDGKHLYAFLTPSDTNKTVLRHFTIASDGSLTFVDDTLTTPAAGAFFCPSEILVSANDKLLYFVDGCADNFQVWLRDTTTGSLKYIGAEDKDHEADNIPSLAFSQENNISFSNDGHFAIAAVNAGITTLNLTANIALTSDFQKTVFAKDTYNGVITLTNLGPADAHDIEITITGNALAGLKSASVSMPQGTCNKAGEPLVCKLPSLANKGAETIELKLQAPDSLDPLHIDVVKTQAEIDSDTPTDSLQIVIQPVAATSSSSSSQSSSVQSSSSSALSSSSSAQSSVQSSSSSAQSSTALQQSIAQPSKSGGGSIGFEWLLMLSLFYIGRSYKK